MPSIWRQPDQDGDTLTTNRPSSRRKSVSDVLNERVAAIVI